MLGFSLTNILNDVPDMIFLRAAREVDGGRGRRVRVLPGAALHDGGGRDPGEGGAGEGGLHRAQDTGGGRRGQGADNAVMI